MGLPDLYPHLDLKPLTSSERFIFDEPLTVEHALPGIGTRAAAALAQANLMPASAGTPEATLHGLLAELKGKPLILGRL